MEYGLWTGFIFSLIVAVKEILTFDHNYILLRLFWGMLAMLFGAALVGKYLI